MTRGEIWKDFFKKTVLTVIVAGFSSCFPQSRRSIPRGFSPSVSSWLVAPFCLQDFCLGRLLGIIHHLHIASHLWNRFSSANPFSFSVSLSGNGVFNLDDVGKFCPIQCVHSHRFSVDFQPPLSWAMKPIRRRSEVLQT